MKTVFLLYLAVALVGCDQAPEPSSELSPSATPVVKATPVRNAPQTRPIPIQPLTMAPTMPQAVQIPAIINPVAAKKTPKAKSSASPAESLTPSAVTGS
jgi:hypothetical protein